MGKKEIIEGSFIAIESELYFFNERYEEGNKISVQDWLDKEFDWDNSIHGGIKTIIKYSDQLTLEQKEKYNILVEQIKALKSKIIEKGYDFPKEIE